MKSIISRLPVVILLSIHAKSITTAFQSSFTEPSLGKALLKDPATTGTFLVRRQQLLVLPVTRRSSTSTSTSTSTIPPCNSRRSTTTRLWINFGSSWFGGGSSSSGSSSNSSSSSSSSDKPEDEKVSAGATTAARKNFEGVSSIMDSMKSFKSSQKVGDRTSTILQELSNLLVEGSSSDGKVKVTCNGQQRPLGVQIDETYFQSLKNNKAGAEELSTALTKAMQEAHSKSSQRMEEKMKSFYSDLGFDVE